MRKAISLMWVSLLIVAPAQAVQESRIPQHDKLDEILFDAIVKHEIPGIAAAVIVDGKLVAAGVAGVRKWGAPEHEISLNDKLHLGSCTKAMTATLIGILVRQGKMKWSDTIAQRLPEIKDRIDAAYRDITLWQILTHRGAIKSIGPFRKNQGVATKQNRLEIIAEGLDKKPDKLEVGKFEYSNLGYIVAGVMAESATGSSWEELIQKELFRPLEMKTAGFGPPSTDGKIDHPWGHIRNSSQIFANQIDNAPSLGPAGTVHCSIVDWAKFVELHLDLDCQQHQLLDRATLRKLHTTPQGSNESYAGGWLVEQTGDTFQLAHEGSNVFWLSTVFAYPQQRRAILVVSNMTPEIAHDANHAVVRQVKKLDFWDE